MSLGIAFPMEPMEAKIASKLPAGPEWEYEPKWDGFRCIAIKDGDRIELQSKALQPLTRYFPEIVSALKHIKAPHFAVDGELVLPISGKLSFDDLLQRIHPAAKRVEFLSKKTPAKFVLFDLLADETGVSTLAKPLKERKLLLEKFYKEYGSVSEHIQLSLSTRDLSVAQEWLTEMRGQLDGIVAKRIDDPYLSGERAMLKIKTLRSADCVVGGFRYASTGGVVGSLLLGLYDESGLLNHVGFTSSFPAASKESLTVKLEKVVEPPGFTGRAPGGPSRWSTARSAEWQPLRPELVVEVQYDHFTEERFRHGTKLLRWRPDKDARQCAMRQVEFESTMAISALMA